MIRTPAGLVATVLEVLTAVAMAVAVGAAAVRAVRLRRQQRRAAALEIARPLLMAAIADDTERDLAPHALQPHVGRCLDSLAVSLAVKLRGADRAALVDILHRRGTVRRARERTRSLTPVRRLRAVELLGALGIAECRPDLEARLRDRNADVRRAAVRALGRVGGPESAGALIALLDATTRRLPEHGVTLALTRCGPSAVPALTSALQDGGPRARRAAAQVLGWLGATTAVDTLCAALDDPCDDVQVEVITALGRIGVPSAAGPIRARLEPTYPGQVRTAAASALGRLDDATSVPALAAALLDDHQVARSAAAALAQLGQTGRQALTAAAALTVEAREVLAVPAMAGLTLAGGHGVPEESPS